MTSDETRKLIDQYFDNELEKSREPLLFTILSEDDDGREYFKQLNVIHSAVKETVSDFPSELEERIFNSIAEKTKPSETFFKRNFFVNTASLGIAAVMLIISAFLFFEVRDYRSRIENVSEQVKLQNQTIELILNNSLPPVEVRTKRANEIIVNAKL